jgi:hypothetical protein
MIEEIDDLKRNIPIGNYNKLMKVIYKWIYFILNNDRVFINN